MINERLVVSGTRKELKLYFNTHFNPFQPMDNMKPGMKYKMTRVDLVDEAYKNNKIGGHTFGIYFYIDAFAEKLELQSQYFYITDFKQTENTRKNDNVLLKTLKKAMLS